MSNSLLIVFIKNAVKGKVKTRLAKDLGDDKALEIYKQLLSHTQDITQDLSASKSIYYSEKIVLNDIWDQSKYFKQVQKGKHLGEKMSNAFQEEFSNQYDSICIIGSDCYDLSSEVIEMAFESLQKNDFVIGPANDGGYYLIGMNKFTSQIFEDKTYSTHNVFDEAIQEIKKLNKSYFVLPELTDIDDINDLKKFE